ncbi:MAG: exosortase-dependent surface protein XDP1 [Burkholderiales bacterium]
MSNTRLSKALVTIAAMALSAPAAAFITTHLFDGAGGCSGGGYGTRTCTNSDGTVKATAHAFTGDPSNTVVEGAFLGVYGGGLGVTYDGSDPKEDTGSPQHAMDNDGKFEFILIDFGMGNSRILDKVVTGWVDVDADITVLAHSGAGVANPNNQNITGLTTNGWSLVGHYNGTSADSQAIDVNAGNASSRYWLIGAYDPEFVPGPGQTTGSPSKDKYDYLKVYAIKWDKPSDAAEPATLLLLTAGLLAWLSSRRRTAPV